VSHTYEVAIAGLGAMGGATACHLARRGARVIGFDRFAPPHTLGSSHGESRIIRVAYFEDPRYVPLVRRAWDLWLELERETGRSLMRPTGGLMIGPPDSTVVAGALASALEHGLPYEQLDAAELRRRFPAHRPAEGDVAIHEPQAGVLDPEKCVEAHLERARALGAELHSDEPVLDWRADGGGVVVRTARGEYRAERLLLTAGAWLARLVPELARKLTVTRQALVWFEPVGAPELFEAERFPIFIREHSPGRWIYGFPRRNGRVKFAIHMEGEPCDPDTVRRSVSDDEIEKVRAILGRCVPDAAGRCVASAVCLYTNTSDGHFVIGAHPEYPQVLIASCCSGHGFKFAPSLGEALADRLQGRMPALDLGAFEMKR
jgi:sarcosine oxidase